MGPMDGYFPLQPDGRDMRPADKMAPEEESAGGSQVEGDPAGELTLIRAELTQISSRMLTKADTNQMVQELRGALWEELAGLRTDLTALEGRVEEVEATAQDCAQQHQATEMAVTRQGNLLLTKRRQVEDLENRSRRSNILVRGLPETDAAPLTSTLEALFQHILGAEAPDAIRF
ncbi:Hypothetical predicted protein [Pelobates cultripes]|uniref:Uncharacterized protein n=1 Tax=Pelobates cultripes TaxID=61616 RepID=A0AAD1QZ08_PELCU|nr:Hypothetical predicted protein [Pelobates cultripes]